MATKTDLVIVESPSKAKTIGKYLGPGYEVKASMGHIRDLPKSKIGVELPEGSEQVDLTKHFTPNYQAIKGKEDVIGDLKKAAKKSGRVFLATDPDREGEAISWHLKELLEIPDDKTYRVTFNEITKKVVMTLSLFHNLFRRTFLRFYLHISFNLLTLWHYIQGRWTVLFLL